jgi:general stress protein 26
MSDMTTEPATPSGRDEAVATVAKLVERARICMLTTTTADGSHVSRPMAVQEVAFDGDLWFFCDDASEKAGQVRSRPQVNVAFSDTKHSAWTSIAGRASVVHDRDKAEELWSPALEVWFADGLETPGLALLKVETETAEYWDAPDSKVKQLVGGLRAAVSGDPDKFPATNETVRLDQR